MQVHVTRSRNRGNAHLDRLVPTTGDQNPALCVDPPNALYGVIVGSNLRSLTCLDVVHPACLLIVLVRVGHLGSNGRVRTLSIPPENTLFPS
jgi:hypothetical protein